MNSYAEMNAIESPIPADRQSAKRHYGVHPYFTRRPHNVVRRYILHYTRERDCVLDPFGGSGVSAVEAFLENRVGIQNDINPLANFIASGVAGLAEGRLADYEKALNDLKQSCKEKLHQIHRMEEDELQTSLARLNLPENISLPSSADVERYYDLFSPRQLASLALLKEAVEAIENPHVRKGLLLAWSATLGKLNKTFLSAEGRAESRGGSSIFSIYRYKVAKAPVELPPWETFNERALNIITAKAEIDKIIDTKRRTGGWLGRFETHDRDVEDLSAEFDGSVDYIFTDPPYGGHISYLDLSVLWNTWLGQAPDFKTRSKELIVGGELGLSDSYYIERLGQSIKACVRLLKPGRWFSVVFQHWSVSYFDAILTSAAESGAELRAAVSQIGDPIWSMHKKKSNESVLAGEMILTFYKTGKPKRVKKRGRFNVSAALGEILASSNSGKIYGEYLFNRIVVEAWRKSAIGSLNISKLEFIDLLRKHGWHYDESNHYWVKNGKSNLSLFSAQGDIVDNPSSHS
jgi:16S rRNA G966 N2-methylase RsmD